MKGSCASVGRTTTYLFQPEPFAIEKVSSAWNLSWKLKCLPPPTPTLENDPARTIYFNSFVNSESHATSENCYMNMTKIVEYKEAAGIRARRRDVAGPSLGPGPKFLSFCSASLAQASLNPADLCISQIVFQRSEIVFQRLEIVVHFLYFLFSHLHIWKLFWYQPLCNMSRPPWLSLVLSSLCIIFCFNYNTHLTTNALYRLSWSRGHYTL